MKVSKYIMGKKSPVFIIAEAGVNHNGRLSLAKKLIDAAKKAGADAIKFQTFAAEDVVTINAKQAKYQEKNTEKQSQFQMLKRLELREDDFRELANYCKRRKIIFLSTPFSEKSADFLLSLGMVAFKISSGELTNLPFLKYVADLGKPMIVSTGMSTLEEIKEAVKVIYSSGNRQLVLLQCTSNYPADLKDINLKVIEALKLEFNLPVGFSDHTKGIDISPAAVALGAKVIEKHLTLDRSLKGPDHKASIEPEDFAKMVTLIRRVETALGTSKKLPLPAEREVMRVTRRSIVAKNRILPGSVISEDMIVIKRPGSGIAPKYFYQVIGQKANCEIKAGKLLSWNMFK